MVDLTQHPDARGLEFPCDTVLIVLGAASESFQNLVESALLEAGAVRTAEPISQRLSSSGHYVSLHVPVHVCSREELETLYARLQTVPGVKYRL